jgi:hypothetical protein
MPPPPISSRWVFTTTLFGQRRVANSGLAAERLPKIAGIIFELRNLGYLDLNHPASGVAPSSNTMHSNQWRNGDAMSTAP